MDYSRRPKLWLVLILIMAFSTRLVAGYWWQQSLPTDVRFRFGDSASYWHLGQTIARGEPYQYGGEEARIFRTPGYPVLLAALIRAVGDNPSVIWARVLGAILGTLAVAAVMFLGWHLFDINAALIGGAVAAVYPGAIATSIFVLAEAPFCPLLVLQLICWTVAVRAECGKRRCLFALIGGLIAGAATLMRPSWLLFTPLVILLSVAFGRERVKHLTIGTAMFVGLATAMLPWWIRSYQITGKFVPTTLQVGASLYDGWNPQASGASNMNFDTQFLKQQIDADAAASTELNSTFEYRLDRRKRDAAVSWASQNPRHVVQLAGIKFARMWNIWPNDEGLSSWPMRFVVMIGYAPVLILAIWGAWKFAPRGWPYVLCFSPAIYFTCLHMIFVSSIRYREPAMLTMIVLAAGVISTVVSKQEKLAQIREDSKE